MGRALLTLVGLTVTCGSPVSRGTVGAARRAVLVTIALWLASFPGSIQAATESRTVRIDLPPAPTSLSTQVSIFTIPSMGNACVTSVTFADGRLSRYFCFNNSYQVVYTSKTTTTPVSGKCSTSGWTVRCVRQPVLNNCFGGYGGTWTELIEVFSGSKSAWLYNETRDASDFSSGGRSLTIEMTDTPASGCTSVASMDLFSPIRGARKVTSLTVPVQGEVTSAAHVDSIALRPSGGAAGATGLFQAVKVSGSLYRFSGTYTLSKGENPIEFVVNDACGRKSVLHQLNLVFGETVPDDVRNEPNCDVPCDPAYPKAKVEKKGNFFLDPPDIDVPGSTPINFERFYNSADPVNGPFGTGWTHRYNLQAIRVRDPETGKRTIIVRWWDGSRLNFTEQSGGVIDGPPGYFLAGKFDQDGRIILSAPDKTNYVFDLKGFIEQIQYDHGRVMTFSYDEPHHRLTSIRTDGGTSIDMEYGTNFKLVSATASTREKAQYTTDKGLLALAVDAAGGTTEYTYSPTKRLTSVVAKDVGTVLSTAYDGLGRVLSYTTGGTAGTAGTSTMRFAYDTTAKTMTTTYADNKSVVQEYDGSNQTKARVDTTGAVNQFSVDAQLQVTSVIDPLNRTTQYAYSPGGMLTSIRAADGTSTVITVERIADAERQTAVRRPSGATTVIRYDETTGLPNRVTDPTGRFSELVHDEKGRVKQISRASGLKTQTTYAAHGAPLAITVAGPAVNGSAAQVATTLIEYDESLRPRIVKDPLGNVTETLFDARGRPKIVTAADGGATEFTRDSLGNITKTINPRKAESSSVFDPIGRVKSRKNALGQETSMVYDARGFLISSTNFRSETTAWEYDPKGRVVKTIDANGKSTRTAYDLAGQLISQTNARNFRTEFGYDQLGRTTNTTNADLTRTSTEYFPDGYVKSSTDELLRKTTYEVDAAGRTTVVHLPDLISTTSTAYDSDGRPVEQTDPLGRKTRTQYDALGRAFKTIVAADTPESITYTTNFDLAGRVSSIETGKGARWSYGYDGVGRKTSETDPLNNTRSWEYDKAGNVTKTTEPDAAGPVVTTMEYDLLNRPTLITRPDEVVVIVYDDPAHKVTTTITRGTVTLGIERRYDKLNRLIYESVGPHFVEYGYDENSNSTSMKLDGVLALSYEFDNRDRCTKITDERASPKRVVAMGYDAAGQMTTLTYPSGIKKSVTYGKRGEVTKVEYLTAQDVAIRTLDYTYDKALRLLTKADSATGTSTFEYDLVDRLTKVTYPGGAEERFAFDKAGNVTSYTSPAGTETRRYDDADQLYMISGANTVWLTHNKRGQLVKTRTGGIVSDSVRDIRFDSSGRLVSVVDDGTPTLDAAYRDGYELHATRLSGDSATDTLYLWSLGNIFTEFNASGTEQNFVLQALGMDTPIERTPTLGGTQETMLTDLLQSAISSYDNAGDRIRSTEYFAYGPRRQNANDPKDADSGPFGFHGARKLGNSGLIYLRNRIMDPAIGRFLSRDPIGFSGGPNLYSYVQGGPSIVRDQLGLKGFVVPRPPMTRGGRVGNRVGVRTGGSRVRTHRPLRYPTRGCNPNQQRGPVEEGEIVETGTTPPGTPPGYEEVLPMVPASNDGNKEDCDRIYEVGLEIAIRQWYRLWQADKLMRKNDGSPVYRDYYAWLDMLSDGWHELGMRSYWDDLEQEAWDQYLACVLRGGAASLQDHDRMKDPPSATELMQRGLMP